ncbi:LamG domain-containing protein [Paenibacillus alvei]|uniref:LamG domain-containing protein n=3 Tax=Paenibacillus TaxID=44249 RepID=A0ABT4E4B7_PAEAL|nr:LamG domain-containing protein [Paenibacillus alvei]MCY9528562.1 LamG domain-containing protein [Paenibacillus alvei]
MNWLARQNKRIILMMCAILFICGMVLQIGNVQASAANVESKYSYDGAGRLNDAQSTTGQSIDYVYDNNGNITHKLSTLHFKGSDQSMMQNLSVNQTSGAKNTVEFWMKWDGTNSVMPFSWNTHYALWFADGFFGFNTGESNIIGIPSDQLKDKWVHVAAIFYNGVPNTTDNELYINGVKQNIAAVKGKTTYPVSATPKAFISGNSDKNLYRFGGKIGEVRIWNYPLSQEEVQTNRDQVLMLREPGLVEYRKLGRVPASKDFKRKEQLMLNNISANNKAGAKNTVEFWMYWDGTDSVLPFSWNTNYSLWFADGYFGFNTGESNIIGISSAKLRNRWVHVAATFYNGIPNAVDNELYINGVKQNLAAVKGNTSYSVAATTSAFISGSGDRDLYRFGGKLGEMRVWSYPLTQPEIKANMYKMLSGMEEGLAGYWKLSEAPQLNSSLKFNSTNQIKMNNVEVNQSAGAKNTVEFWMKWDGTNSVMPFSWNTNYSLWIADGYFGFNTGESNIIGIPSDQLKDKWVHVAAIFYNGVPNTTDNELYINGVKQNITEVKGKTTYTVAATSSAFISGTEHASWYRFGGMLGEMRVWNYPLTQDQIHANLYKVFTGTEVGLAGYWKLDDGFKPDTALHFTSTNQVSLQNIKVDQAAGAKNTVEFWMKWDGTNSVMPFSWNTNYSLWIADGYFGFNTGEGNIIGIPSAQLKDKWVHVAATFYNGVPNATDNELYINGVKQNITAVKGKTTYSVAATPSAFISGNSDKSLYRFAGKLGEMRIWNYRLLQSEVQANIYKVISGKESGLVEHWKAHS